MTVATTLRLAGAAVLLTISLALWQIAGDADWQMQVPTLIAYGTFALVSFMTRGHGTMVRISWLQPLLDVGFAYAALRTSILLDAAAAQPMAALSVAVLLLPVALAGLAYRTRTLVLVTVAATLSNLSLMQQVGLPLWPTIAATAVLLLAASASKLARETVEAEIARRMLAESHARCEELARLQRDKDSLLGIIVHDMRSPVSSAMLSLEYLHDEMKRRIVSQAWSEAAAEGLSACSNLSEMIAQILDTTKLEGHRMPLQISVLDARGLLGQARERCLPHAGAKSIALEIESGEALQVAVDPRLLLRAFESLITCAIRQTPTGGRILLQADKAGDTAKIAIHRTGAPIPADRREGLFEKFELGGGSRPRMAGWGLGLYFCRLAAEAHGATLAVETTEGWGSSYVLRLAQPPTTMPESKPLGGGVRHPTPISLPSSASSTALLSVRRKTPSPKTRAALEEFAHALSPLEADVGQSSSR